MEFENTEVPGVIKVWLKAFEDSRGYFMETYREEIFRKQGLVSHFVQDNLSCSDRAAIRGLHYQIDHAQAKLVMVTTGEILDVAVDVRRGSPTFGRYVTVPLSAADRQMLYIPAGFAHGFQVLADRTIVQYKCSDYYSPGSERGIAWDDPDIGIAWKTLDVGPLVSAKDRAHPKLRDMKQEDLPLFEQ